MLSVPEKCKEINPLVFIKPENVLLCGALPQTRVSEGKGADKKSGKRENIRYKNDETDR